MSRYAIPAWLRFGLGLVLGATLALNGWADTSSLAVSSNTATVTGPSGTTLNFPVSRTGDLSYDAYVAYQTADGTAIAGTDYTAASGYIKIPAGATDASIPVAISGSTTPSSDKTFSLQLQGATGVGPTPTFGPAQTLGATGSLYGVVAADLNGDGKPDLVVAGEGGANSVGVYLNTTAPGATTSSFAAPQNFTAGVYPLAIAAADINGDGKPDIIVSNGDDNTVSVLINTTAPGSTTLSFAPQQAFATAASSMTVADINGDGRPDIIVGNQSNNTVSVLLNTTAPGTTVPSFATPQAFAVGYAPSAVKVADINGDGNPDIVVENVNDNTVSVLLNTTAPGSTSASFADQQVFATGNGPRGMAVVDMNGDGKPDVVTADDYDGTVSVLVNSTAPGSAAASFASRQSFPVISGGGDVSVTAADLNGDGKPDLITTEAPGMNTATVLMNTSAPGAASLNFAPAQTMTTGGDPYFATVADINGDGKPDFIVSDFEDTTIDVMLNVTAAPAAPATFAGQQSVSVGTYPETVKTIDLNGDGQPDLVVPNDGSSSVSLMLNTTTSGAPTPTFAAQQTVATGRGPYAATAADVNGDGKPDLIVVNNLDNTMSVFLNMTPAGASTFTFAAPLTFAVGNNPRWVEAVDVNGDGRPDLVVANFQDNSVSVLLNTTAPGATTPSFSPQQAFAVGNGTQSVAIADLNGDGKPDLVTANDLDSTVSVLLNTTPTGAATPIFAAQQTFTVGANPRHVTVADVNADGLPDVITADFGAATVSVLLNTTPAGATSATFASRQAFAVSGALSVAAADLNGDGMPDLVAADISDNSLSVLVNTSVPGATTPSFASQQTVSAGSPRQVVVADVNGDGKPDLLAPNINQGSVTMLLNTQYATSVSPSTVTGTIHYNLGTPAASLSATSLAFGSQAMGSTSAASAVTLTDSGSGTLAGIALSISGANPGDFAQTSNCPASLAPGGNCTIDVTFAPGGGGSRSASLVITSNASSSPDTVSLTGSGVDVPATANNGNVSTTADQAVSGSLSATIAYTGQTLTYSSVSAPANGTVSVNPSSGAFTYTPANGYVGADSFTFQATDGNGTASNIATESVTVNDVAATANAGTATTGPDQAVSGSLSATAAYSGQTLTYFIVAQPGHGTASITNSAAGAFVYTPATGYAGPDSFTFRAQDQAGTYSNTASVSVTVTDIAPTANNGSAATLAGVAVSGSLSATPAYSGQILTYSLAGSPTNGTVSITNASTGAYTYTPKSGFAGSDSFTFKATDQAGTASNTATVSVTVNDRPATANDGSVATTADTSVNGTILAATSYPGQTFTYSIVSSPAHGSLTLNNNMTGSFTYIPATGYVGADSFTFNATDAYGTVSNTATESVTVNDTAPTALAGTDSTSPDVAVSYTLAAGAYAGQTLTFSVAANPAHGSVTITNAGTGAFTYTPAQGFAGSDGFTFKVIDQYGSSSTATETIVVIDQAPVASGGNILTSPDLGVNGTLPAMAAYAGQTLTFSVSANPSHGTFNITNASTGAFTYTPATGYAGTDSFAYQVTDQWGASATATESVTVNDIAPTISGTTAFSMTHNTTHSGSFTSTPQYSGQVLTFGVVTNPAHGTLTLNATTGAYTYKPATGYKGSDSFSVNVTDQWGTASNTLTVTVSVK